ncbi:hypothetical protein VCHA34P129_10073 [Vibrio chagasii]|nr:hypothetical protein VCHA34P129_10073 [Vibrio chagasii]CAH6866820.1 hypothetical protein VCHA34P120_10592 [Vibrio chagasii]CAH7030026.1 hypothetical protein VCHA52P455_10005 [Vibrio chagasii]CAH7256180.1 hypothetical protein VCHA53O464_10402 [Vibrio chagasii]
MFRIAEFLDLFVSFFNSLTVIREKLNKKIKRNFAHSINLESQQ